MILHWSICGLSIFNDILLHWSILRPNIPYETVTVVETFFVFTYFDYMCIWNGNKMMLIGVVASSFSFSEIA